MKKIGLLIFVIFNTLMLSSCLKISTPEELLQVPELSSEKRDMKDAVNNFRLQNTSAYPVTVNGDKTSSSMIIRDLDADGVGEIVSFYKRKEDDKIGVFILSKSNDIWVKIADISFDSYEISKVNIVDLNNNKKKEIVVEAFEPTDLDNPKVYSIIYYNGKDIGVIKEIPYTVFRIYDIDDDKVNEIFTIKKSPANSGFVLNVSEFEDYSLKVLDTYNLKEVKNPYNMAIGGIYDDKKAIFIDYLMNEEEENAQILLYDAGSYVELSKFDEYKQKQYVFNIQSKDIDKDGYVEVGYTFKAPNYNVRAGKYDIDAVSGYFKIKNDFSLELVSEKLVSKLGFVFNIPKSFSGKYKVSYSDSENTNENIIYINYVDSKGREYPFINLSYMRKYDYILKKDSDYTLQLIIDGQDYVLVGNLIDSNNLLKGEDSINYMTMKSDALILSNLVKEDM